MLARQYRLPATVKLLHARFAKTEYFSVKYSSNNMAISRFAFVVRKSSDKRAVVRNRIRRVFRSCIEELREQIFPGYDMLFFLEKGIMEIKRDTLYNDLRSFLIEKHLINETEIQIKN